MRRRDPGFSDGPFEDGIRAAAEQLREQDATGPAIVWAQPGEKAPPPAETRPVPAQASPGHYVIGHQHGNVVSNVGRDQYIQQIVEPPDGPRPGDTEISTWAKWGRAAGLLITLAGFGLFAAAVLRSVTQFSQDTQGGGSSSSWIASYPGIARIPFEGIGIGMAGAGIAMAIVISVLDRAIAALRKRAGRGSAPAVPPAQPAREGG